MMEEGKNYFTAEYEAGRIKNFEKAILAGGGCKGVLPVSFVAMGDVDRVSYDYCGFRKLGGAELERGMELMEVLEKCVFAMLEACNHLLSPKRMVLSVETVFYHPRRKEVRFSFVPGEAAAESVTGVFGEFVEELLEKAEDKEVRGYLAAVSAYISENNCSLFDVINCIGEIKQEINACG